MRANPIDLIGIPIILATFAWLGSILLHHPTDLPTYPNALNVHKGPSEAFRGLDAWQFETNDAPSTIEAFYRETLTDRGWEQEQFCSHSYYRSGDWHATFRVVGTSNGLTSVALLVIQGPFSCGHLP